MSRHRPHVAAAAAAGLLVAFALVPFGLSIAFAQVQPSLTTTATATGTGTKSVPTNGVVPPPKSSPIPTPTQTFPMPKPQVGPPLSLSNRKIRPNSDPEPTEIFGLLRYSDPATGELHFKTGWDRDPRTGVVRWSGLGYVYGLVVVFRPRAGGEEIRVAIHQLNGGGETSIFEGPWNPTEIVPAGLKYRIRLAHNTSLTGPPAVPPIGSPANSPNIIYNPRTHTLVALELNNAKTGFACTASNPNCKAVEPPFQIRSPNWPEEDTRVQIRTAGDLH